MQIFSFGVKIFVINEDCKFECESTWSRSRTTVKEILVRNSLDVVILQETKIDKFDKKLIMSIWGPRYRNWATLSSCDRSGVF